MRSLSFLFLTVLFLQACGGGGGYGSDGDRQQEETSGTTGGGSPDKNLFSLWTRTDGRSIDLSGADFNRSTSFRFEFNLGSSCNCRIRPVGSQTNGTFALSSCSWNFDGPGDPGCVLDNGTASYQKSGNELRWSCNVQNRPSPCGIYH